MNIDDQLDSTLFIPEDSAPSFGNTLDSTGGSVSVHLTQNLLDGALFIVSNGTLQDKDITSYWQRSIDLCTHIFDGVTTLNDNAEYFFHGLIKAYADLYDIDLHLIVYIDDRYTIIDKNKFFRSDVEPYNREKHAFIWCNKENTLYAPVFIENVHEQILTVFKTDEVFAWQYVKAFVSHINQELNNTVEDQIEQQINPSEDLVSHMAVDTSLSTNHLTSLITPQPEPRLGARTFITHMLEQIYQLTKRFEPSLNEIYLADNLSDFDLGNVDSMSPKELAITMQQRLQFTLNVVEKAIEQIPQDDHTTISSNILEENEHQGDTTHLDETNYVAQAEQNPTDVQSVVPSQLSNTTQVPQNYPITTTTQIQVDVPTVLIQPKREWHYRNMKDLGKSRNPLLAGDGPQRTSIRVQVPQQGEQRMYLGVKVQTHDNRDHPSKVLVPEHTTVNMNNFSNDNDLDRLQFDQCNHMDYFDPSNRYVYLVIDPREHEIQRKDVRIHMFNLYQSGSITREMIEREQLFKCKLAFWLCLLEDGAYKPISSQSLSCLIAED